MMRKMIAALVSVAACLLGALMVPVASSFAEEAQSAIEQGKEIAFDRKGGNCLACHMIATGDLPGNIGPPLVAMAQRYPDKAKLRAQIWDATVANPHSSMPPFGRNRILSEKEIDLVTEFIYVQ
jgi:sulfur-oxidizing protein SoxX